MVRVIKQDQEVLTTKLGRKIMIGFLRRKTKKMNTLKRNKYNQKIFGVCSGIADWLNTDATLVRIIFVAGALLTGSILFWIYLILAFILPSE